MKTVVLYIGYSDFEDFPPVMAKNLEKINHENDGCKSAGIKAIQNHCAAN
jgi:hypothetical protein